MWLWHKIIATDWGNIKKDQLVSGTVLQTVSCNCEKGYSMDHGGSEDMEPKNAEQTEENFEEETIDE